MIRKQFIPCCFFFLLLISGCTSEKSKKNTEPNTVDSSGVIPQVEPADTLGSEENISTDTIKYPMLSSKNAVPFLLQYFKDNPERKIKLTTRLGTIKFRLFDDTPIHTANFLMLVKRHYFDNTEFTRIVKNFVVQGGNNDKESEEIKRLLIGSYELPPEIKENRIHQKGALAMARRYDENQEKLSSAYNFYFVEGQKFTEPQLLAIERDNEMTIPEWKRKIYRQIGGAPHLDGQHTVFGEIYEGLDVLHEMANVKTDQSDWPKVPIIMKMEVIYE